MVSGIGPVASGQVWVVGGMVSIGLGDLHILPHPDLEPRRSSEEASEEKAHRQTNACLRRLHTPPSERTHRLLPRRLVTPDPYNTLVGYTPPHRKVGVTIATW